MLSNYPIHTHILLIEMLNTQELFNFDRFIDFKADIHKPHTFSTHPQLALTLHLCKLSLGWTVKMSGE